jgi:hypothetical protein
MNKKEIIKECQEMIDNGADMVEIFEWVEDNTDLDPAEIVNEIYKREVFI